MTPQEAQQGSHEARDVNGLEVVGLAADVRPHALALGDPVRDARVERWSCV
jgi:hypothetical protein